MAGFLEAYISLHWKSTLVAARRRLQRLDRLAEA